MTRRILFILLIVNALSCAVAAQDSIRYVTPVKPATNVTLAPPRGTSEDVIKRFLTGDSTAAEQERRDSLKRVYTHYPLITDVSVGLNFIEPILMAMGQDYAGVDVHATLNLWNRLQPVVEVGLGWAKSTPDDMNFTYHSKPSLYAKIGCNYNFMFKSEPRYQAIIGVRAGFSAFHYDVTDVTYRNSYWDETTTFSMRDISSNALWGEALAGIKVGITPRWSLGWTIRYHRILSYKKSDNGKPWYIPGYGPRSRSLAFSFSLAYTFTPGKAKANAHPDADKQ